MCCLRQGVLHRPHRTGKVRCLSRRIPIYHSAPPNLPHLRHHFPRRASCPLLSRLPGRAAEGAGKKVSGRRFLAALGRHRQLRDLRRRVCHLLRPAKVLSRLRSNRRPRNRPCTVQPLECRTRLLRYASGKAPQRYQNLCRLRQGDDPRYSHRHLLSGVRRSPPKSRPASR